MSLVSFLKKEWPHVAALTAGLGTAVAGFVQNQGGVKEATMGIAGLAVAGVSTVAKQLKDGKVDAATVEAAGSDLTKQLPSLRADLANVASFVETEWPASKTLISDLSTRVAAVETRAAATVSSIEPTVRSVLTAALAATPATVAPSTPSAAT